MDAELSTYVTNYVYVANYVFRCETKYVGVIDKSDTCVVLTDMAGERTLALAGHCCRRHDDVVTIR